MWMKLLARWILKTGSRHELLEVLSLDFISSSDLSCGCMFSVVSAEEWIFDLLVHAPSCLDSSTWNPQTILLPAWEALAAEGAACNSLFLLPGCTKIFNIIKKKKVCISSP